MLKMAPGKSRRKELATTYCQISIAEYLMLVKIRRCGSDRGEAIGMEEMKSSPKNPTLCRLLESRDCTNAVVMMDYRQRAIRETRDGYQCNTVDALNTGPGCADG